ncbi:MAG: Asp-tRNA(Asn)/Glu-tRNA(Gln) amidotransferase subunit GatC [Pediococcus sp.]|nr:Asp-tRNA(Asn)/Glu-tRNA(Gln) amidotransferase subunit GatC [Pediococcus sp.]
MANEEKIDKAQVEHVASLAKLEFNDADLGKFTTQLADIMGLFNTLSEVDTTGVEPTFSVTDQFNTMREDVAVNSHEKDALIKNVPDTQDGYIRVPAIIDESEGAN